MNDATKAAETPEPEEPRHLRMPAFLLAMTCLSTFWAGAADWNPTGYAELVYREIMSHRAQGLWEALLHGWGLANSMMNWSRGFYYMGLVLVILLAHEMGHFLMALRNRIPASFPYFIPLPIVPFGTLGAVIGMEGSKANRRELFDLGIAGPLAGLVLSIPALWIGVWSMHDVPPGRSFCFDNPLLLQYMIRWIHPDYPTPQAIWLNQFNPFLMAGWVGLLVTGLNMLPVSQLDGGHVAYALMKKPAAHYFARTILIGAIAYIIFANKTFWIVMLLLVLLLGIDHPPTADDDCEIGLVRRILGWASLLIPILCFPAGGITP